jgi:hypothetical protein
MFFIESRMSRLLEVLLNRTRLIQVAIAAKPFVPSLERWKSP